MKTYALPANVPDPTDTRPMRTRFILLDGKPRVFTNRVQKIEGTHRGYRLIFDTEGIADVLREQEWRRLLMKERIRPLPSDRTMELLSDCIGQSPEEHEGRQPLTPQDALHRALVHLSYKSAGEEIEATGRVPAGAGEVSHE